MSLARLTHLSSHKVYRKAYTAHHELMSINQVMNMVIVQINDGASKID